MREENLPEENEEQKQRDRNQENAEVEEHLVVSEATAEGASNLGVGDLPDLCEGPVLTHLDARFASTAVQAVL